MFILFINRDHIKISIITIRTITFYIVCGYEYPRAADNTHIHKVTAAELISGQIKKSLRFGKPLI